MLKKTSSPLILFFLLLIPNKPTQAVPPASKLALYATSALAATYLGYLSCSIPQEFTPTIENLHTLSAIPVKDIDIAQSASFFSAIPKFSPPKGSILLGLLGAKEPVNPSLITIKNTPYIIQMGAGAAIQEGPIWIASCGWDPRIEIEEMRGINPNIQLAKRYLGRNIIHGPALFFAHNDARRIFGQETDQNNIDFMCRLVPGKKILHGLCRGATAILGYLQHYAVDNNVCAVIFESPAISLKTACRDYIKNNHYPDYINKFVHAFYTFYYPNYNPAKSEEHPAITTFNLPHNVPIFIGNLKGDTTTTDAMVTELVKELRQKTSNPIYYFVCDDPTLIHARLSASKEYQKAVNAFLKRYNLPHDEELALQGQELLATAQERAEQLKTEKPAALPTQV